MPDDESVLGARTLERSAPAAADPISFTGGLGIVIGVFLLSADFFAHGHGRGPAIVLFAVMIVVGYLVLGLLPQETHPAAVTMIVAGVPGMLGWWLLPNADKFGDIRPFLILTILAWAGCWFLPRTRGRTIFVAAALLVFWFWMIGEVAGPDAYSAAPVPSPPAHTTFSLSGFSHSGFSLSALRSQVSLSDLDPDSPFYIDAAQCNLGVADVCDSLYDEAPFGSDFHEFADTCGNRQPAGSGDQCRVLSQNGFSLPDNSGSLTPSLGGGLVPRAEIGVGSGDKSLEIGLVSLLFGIAYIGALWVFDQRSWHGLATAFVVPGFLALFTGTEMLGNAANHAWFGGVLTFFAGVALALVGDFGGRRFTTWAGGVFAAFGVYTFAVDVTDFRGSFNSLNPSLVRPALITMAFGAALITLALFVSVLRTRFTGPSGYRSASIPPGPPPWQQPGYQPPVAPPPAYPTYEPPAAPPPSAPWQPPPVPPPSPPWQAPEPPAPPTAPPASAPWQTPPPPPPPPERD